MKNIVYFFCDELRQDALGCYGNPAGPMHTPNIDAIAQRGFLFENCFCNSPVCVPSRTSLMTGLYPEDTGVYNNEAAVSTFTLPTPVITFPEVLRKAGYHTANFGKTHLPPGLTPFETHNPEGSGMGLGLTYTERQNLQKISPRSGLSFNAASLYPEGKEYFPEKVTENALEWLSCQSEPYFLRISYTQPHSPIILKRGYENIYRDYPFDSELPEIAHLSEFEQAFAHTIGLETLSKEELRTIKAYYYGMVCWIDDEIGKVIDLLQSRDELSNTIIIVGADHGALRGECCGLGKHIFQRASQAVPLIIVDPMEQKKGQRITSLCSNIDIPRTLFSLIGMEAPRQFKGRNLFDDSSSQPVYATIGYGEADSCAFPARQLGRLPGGHGWPRRACIRQEQYRLDMNIRVDGLRPSREQEDIFFVDCKKYPAEDYNMTGDPTYTSVIEELTAKLSAHCRTAVEADPAQLHVPAELVRGTRQ